MRFVPHAVAMSLSMLALVCGIPARGQTPSRPQTNPSDLLVIVQNGKYGYIDHQGKIVIQPQYIWGEDFWHGLAAVYVCGRYVSLDPAGDVHPLRIALPDELVPKRVGEKIGFVDARGSLKIPAEFDDALPFQDGLSAVEIGDKWGFIDTNGRQVIRPQFEEAYYFTEGAGLAKSKDEDVIIDKTGKVISSGFEYVIGPSISEGRIPASQNDKDGYLDLQGKVVIPFVYDGEHSFSEGLAAVERGDRWGYIDRDGRMMIPFEFDDAQEFANGLAAAKKGSETGFIDKSGRFAFHLDFEGASGFVSASGPSLQAGEKEVSRFWTKDRHFGYVDTSGKVIWGPIDESPDHTPIFGWSDEGNIESCEGVPESVRKTIASFRDD
jgi:WG repeat protein